MQAHRAACRKGDWRSRGVIWTKTVCPCTWFLEGRLPGRTVRVDGLVESSQQEPLVCNPRSLEHGVAAAQVTVST